MQRTKILLSALMVGLLCTGFLAGLVVNANASAQSGYKDTIANYQAPYAHTANSSCPVGPCSDKVETIASFSVTIGTQDMYANQTLLDHGWAASCKYLCFGGISYFLDPTTHITNNGVDFFQLKYFGSAHAVTCTGTGGCHANGTWIAFTTSSSTPAFTDTGCGGGAGSGQITSGGLDNAAGTITAGTPASGVATTTNVHTFTAAETDSSVQGICLSTADDASSPILLMWGQFGPVTLVTGNTIAVTISWATTGA